LKSQAENSREYQRAGRLLASKLGVDWRTLPREQVEEYMRKLEIAGQMCLTKNQRKKRRESSDSP
jgi:hypothetical protein